MNVGFWVIAVMVIACFAVNMLVLLSIWDGVQKLKEQAFRDDVAAVKAMLNIKEESDGTAK